MTKVASAIIALCCGLFWSTSGHAQAYASAAQCADLSAQYGTSYRPMIVVEPNGPARTLMLASAITTGNVQVGPYLVKDVPLTRFTVGSGTLAYAPLPGSQKKCRMEAVMAHPAQWAAWAEGGIRLQLKQDDTIDLRLSSELASLDPGSNLDPRSRPGQAVFGGVPCQAVNNHTHGLLVDAQWRGAQPVNDHLLGDDVLHATGPMTDACASGGQAMNHAHMVDQAPLHYRIRLPHKATHEGEELASGNHPSGLFWFHPHPHGYSSYELQGATSGLITIGSIGDYAPALGNYFTTHPKNLRYLMLKDMQILGGGTDWHFSGAYAPDLCAQSDGGKLWRDGQCASADGRKWLFPVSGKLYPQITDVKVGEFEVWRIANASASMSFRLSVVDKEKLEAAEASGRPAPTGHQMCLLSRDGIAATSQATRANRCNSVVEILLMPSSRVELAFTPPNRKSHVLITRGVSTGEGDAGDKWPAVRLAEYTASAGGHSAQSAIDVGPLKVTGPSVDVLTTHQTPAPMALAQYNGPPRCAPLGTRERVVMLVINPQGTYAGKDQFGIIAGIRNRPSDSTIAPDPAVMTVYSGSTSNVIPFATAANYGDHPNSSAGSTAPSFAGSNSSNDVCVSGGPGVQETWVVENWTGEEHNFHLHQAKFAVDISHTRADVAYYSFPALPSSGSGGSREEQLIASFYPGNALALSSGDAEVADESRIFHDNVPIPRGSPGCNGKAGNPACKPGRVTLWIPFNRREQYGRYVFHCHILEHEDRGMMGSIEVHWPGLPAPPEF